MLLTREEISRKLLHLGALLMPICIFYGPQWSFPRLFVALTLFILFSVSLVVEWLRFRVPAIQRFVIGSFGALMRQEEHHCKISGSTWLIGAAFLCAILFTHYRYVSFAVLSLFILGDAAAALVGLSIGRIKIGRKSLEGSLACLAVCLILFYAVFPVVPGLLPAFKGGMLSHLTIWSISILITILELVPLKVTRSLIINDNLAVPVVAGYAMILLGRL